MLKGDNLLVLILGCNSIWPAGSCFTLGSTRIADYCLCFRLQKVTGPFLCPFAIKNITPVCHMRRGQSPTSPVVKFDIRDKICVAVGGFKHGEVVMYAGTKYAVVGVHQSYEDPLGHGELANGHTDSYAVQPLWDGGF